MASRNGAIAKALDLRPPYEPSALSILLEARREVLLGLATTDAEASMVREGLCGWEERPMLSRFLEQLERRAADAEDIAILRKASGLRILLPEAPPEPPRDPELERLILEQATKKAQAEVLDQLALDKVVLTSIELRKAKTPADVVRLEAQQTGAIEERKQTTMSLEREISKLADLLQRRENRRRAFLAARPTS